MEKSSGDERSANREKKQMIDKDKENEKMKVKNGACIRMISRKAMAAAHTRNRIAIVAIALTTLLFTTLFTIAFSLYRTVQEANFRQVGAFHHGGFKSLSKEQCDASKTDPLIQAYGLRRFVGTPLDEPFQKSHVEISYSDSHVAHWMFCDPIEGRLPKEGSNEAATDLKILSLLGTEPKIGTEFTITFEVEGTETTQTFVLCGWWEYDSAIATNHVLLPESRAEEILEELDAQGMDRMTTLWDMYVMLLSSFSIERDLITIAERHGYVPAHNRAAADGHTVVIGVNASDSGAQFFQNVDSLTVISIMALLLIIMFTGYLIIYNVFQISVTNEIRFYGLLKTIGITGRQIRRILYGQARFLSAVGIPIGLLCGYGIGIRLVPVIAAQILFQNYVVSTSPLIFIGAIFFSLITVWISCMRPGKIAAKVSPIEAVRSTEGRCPERKKNVKYGNGKVSLFQMAWANLGHNRGKTTVTILSMALSAVLLNITVTYTNGFDLDKYLAQMAADFIVAEASYFQNSELFSEEKAVSEEVISLIEEQGKITKGGRIYGMTLAVMEFVDEEYYRRKEAKRNHPDAVDWLVEQANRNKEGKLEKGVRLYGMERYALERLTVVDGDISKFYSSGNYIAAVYREQFESVRLVVLLFGGVLSLIIGMVGVLNFLNALLTGMIARKREFAVLQAIGMTGRQLQMMLIWEGIYDAGLAIGVAVFISIWAMPLVTVVFRDIFWFFTYRVTVLPLICMIAFFLGIGVALPVVVYRKIGWESVVERLREIE